MPDYFAMLLDAGTSAPATPAGHAAQKVVDFTADRPARAFYSLYKGRPMINVEVKGAAVLHLSCLDFARARKAVEELSKAGETPPKPTK